MTDNSGKANTCDDVNDPVGCIFTLKLLVPDVTEAEIQDAVKGGAGGNSTVKSISGTTSSKVASSAVTTTTDASNSTASPAATAGGKNVQTFTGALGGPAPAVIQDVSSNRPFSVDGSTFLKAKAALGRSCAMQHNTCADAANAGAAFSIADCGAQQEACNAAAAASTARRRAHKYRRAALDFGSCGSPAIVFKAQSDRGNVTAFAPANKKDFNHGSANAIKVITGFICQQLGDKCKAAAEVVTACDAAATAADALKGQAAADAYNSALGVSA